VHVNRITEQNKDDTASSQHMKDDRVHLVMRLVFLSHLRGALYDETDDWLTQPEAELLNININKIIQNTELSSTNVSIIGLYKI